MDKMTKESDSKNERIVELETRQAFQENTIEELNEVIISHQQQLDRLENLVVLLQKKLAELLDESKDHESDGP